MRSMLSIAIRLGFLLTVLLPRAGAAQEVMDHVRADRWAEAQAAVAGHPDPVARKLVAWMRLMAPGQGRVDEIGAFLATNPDWPMQVSLARRRDEALALEPDNALARAECKRAAPTLTGALLRCADALIDDALFARLVDEHADKRRSAEAQEGLASFAEKREAAWYRH